VNGGAKNASIPIGPLVAAIGALLLIVSLFLDWYEGLTGFTVFEFLDLLLLLLALSALVTLVGGLGLVRPVISPGLALAIAVFTLLVVVSQIVNHPPAAVGDPGDAKDTGIWLGLAGAAVMVAGAVLGYAHISLAVETRPRAAGGPADADSDPTNPLPRERP
jgi:hypothetical protein